MRKLSKKISMLMVLAMLVSLFSGVVSASAASMWSFKSTNGKFDVAVKETIIMEKNEYADFDLYKEGEKVTKATYTAVWESSDPDVVWVDATNGRLRADKFGKAEAGDKAMISATFTNVETKKSATRSFYIEIAADPVVEEPEYKIAVNFGEEAFVTGEKYDLVGVVTADGEEIEADVVFSIDGKAIEGAYAPTEAGDVTIVATVTIDGEEYTKSYDCVVKSKSVEIVAVEQVKLDQIRVIFNDAKFAAQSVAAAAEDIEATFELTFNADKDLKEGEDRVDHELYFAEADKDNANCVYINLYKKLEDGLKYKLEYKVNGKVVAYNWVTGTNSIPATVEVVEKGYVVGDYRNLEYVVYNNKDVIINSISAAAGGFDAELYPIEWSLVSEESENYDFDVEAGAIYFLEKGAKAEVKISIDMGYDEDANEVADVVDTGIVWGVDDTDKNINPLGYLVKGAFDGDTAHYVSSTTPQIFFVGEGDVDNPLCPELYLFAYYKNKTENGTQLTYYIANGESDDANCVDIFTYQSSNTDIVSVDETTGQVYPVAVGTAKVYIKVEGNVIGYATVQVLKQSELVKFSADVISGSKVSVAYDEDPYHGIWNQRATVKETYTNQRGDNLQLGGDVKYELVSIIKDRAATPNVYKGEEGLDDLFTVVQIGDNKVEFWPDVDKFTDPDTGILKDGKKITVKIKATVVFECKDGKEIEKVDTFSFQIKNIEGVKAKDPTFEVTSNIDMNLAKVQGDPDSLAKREGSIKLTQYEAEGFFIREVPFTFVDDATAKETVDAKAAESVSAGAYTVVITKGDYALDDTDEKHIKLAPETTANVCGHCGEIFSATVSPFDVDGDEITKADKGSYKVRLYKGNGTDLKLVTTKTMKVTDSTKDFYIQKVKEYIDGFDTIDELAAAVRFFSGEGVEMKYGEAGKGLNLISSITVDHDYKTDDTSRVYIYNVKVDLPIKAYNAKWNNSTQYTEVTIVVDKTFTEK